MQNVVERIVRQRGQLHIQPLECTKAGLCATVEGCQREWLSAPQFKSVDCEIGEVEGGKKGEEMQAAVELFIVLDALCWPPDGETAAVLCAEDEVWEFGENVGRLR